MHAMVMIVMPCRSHGMVVMCRVIVVVAGKVWADGRVRHVNDWHARDHVRMAGWAAERV